VRPAPPSDARVKVTVALVLSFPIAVDWEVVSHEESDDT
jgi:hypothetical protein